MSAYRELYRLSITHAYHGGGFLPDCRIVPAGATRTLMERCGLIMRQLPDALVFLMPGARLDVLRSDIADAGGAFPFLLCVHAGDPLLASYTAPSTPPGMLPVADSRRGAADEAGAWRLHPDEHLGAESLAADADPLCAAVLAEASSPLVPVAEYDGASSQQLADDIVYASDNYYGIGFWAVPFADAAGVAGVNALLSENFHPADGHSEDWDRYVGLLCPERLWVRGIFWVTLLMAIGVGGFYFSCRGCNERLDSSGVYFAATLLLIALPLLALLVLAVSDPLLEPYQPLLMFLFGAGGLVVAAIVTRYYFNKSRRKLP
jgi:hypothetical protein